MRYPNDADGHALARLAADGVDMSRKRPIDFYFYVDREELLHTVCKLLLSAGYMTRSFRDVDTRDRSKQLSVYAEKTIEPTYENVLRGQKEVNAIIGSFGLKCDGWGTAVLPTEKRI